MVVYSKVITVGSWLLQVKLWSQNYVNCIVGVLQWWNSVSQKLDPDKKDNLNQAKLVKLVDQFIIIDQL